MSDAAAARWVARAWALLVASSALYFLADNEADNDLWVHLFSGRLILASGAVPRVDDVLLHRRRAAVGRSRVAHAGGVRGRCSTPSGSTGLWLGKLAVALLTAWLVWLPVARRSRSPWVRGPVMVLVLAVAGARLRRAPADRHLPRRRRAARLARPLDDARARPSRLDDRRADRRRLCAVGQRARRLHRRPRHPRAVRRRSRRPRPRRIDPVARRSRRRPRSLARPASLPCASHAGRRARRLPHSLRRVALRLHPRELRAPHPLTEWQPVQPRRRRRTLPFLLLLGALVATLPFARTLRRRPWWAVLVAIVAVDGRCAISATRRCFALCAAAPLAEQPDGALAWLRARTRVPLSPPPATRHRRPRAGRAGRRAARPARRAPLARRAAASSTRPPTIRSARCATCASTACAAISPLPLDWGGYALWHAAPAIKVSLDGRFATVYPPRGRRGQLRLLPRRRRRRRRPPARRLRHDAGARAARHPDAARRPPRVAAALHRLGRRPVRQDRPHRAAPAATPRAAGSPFRDRSHWAPVRAWSTQSTRLLRAPQRRCTRVSRCVPSRDRAERKEMERERSSAAMHRLGRASVVAVVAAVALRVRQQRRAVARLQADRTWSSNMRARRRSPIRTCSTRGASRTGRSARGGWPTTIRASARCYDGERQPRSRRASADRDHSAAAPAAHPGRPRRRPASCSTSRPTSSSTEGRRRGPARSSSPPRTAPSPAGAQPSTRPRRSSQSTIRRETRSTRGSRSGTNSSSSFLYATNFHDRAVDVFDGTFTPVDAERVVRRSQHPGRLRAVRHPEHQRQHLRHLCEAGRRHGGRRPRTRQRLRRRVRHRRQLHPPLRLQGQLNSPWGVVLAPISFGRFGGALIIGNFGDGQLNAFGPDGRHVPRSGQSPERQLDHHPRPLGPRLRQRRHRRQRADALFQRRTERTKRTDCSACWSRSTGERSGHAAANGGQCCR